MNPFHSRTYSTLLNVLLDRVISFLFELSDGLILTTAPSKSHESILIVNLVRSTLLVDVYRS